MKGGLGFVWFCVWGLDIFTTVVERDLAGGVCWVARPRVGPIGVCEDGHGGATPTSSDGLRTHGTARYHRDTRANGTKGRPLARVTPWLPGVGDPVWVTLWCGVVCSLSLPRPGYPRACLHS